MRDCPIIEQIESKGFYGNEPEFVHCEKCGTELSEGDTIFYNAEREELFCHDCMMEYIINKYPYIALQYGLEDDPCQLYDAAESLGFSSDYPYEYFF